MKQIQHCKQIHVDLWNGTECIYSEFFDKPFPFNNKKELISFLKTKISEPGCYNWHIDSINDLSDFGMFKV